ncbi:hypothetical protein EDB86DRAFT_1311813 [Lactarius hatsudake]|nr:hypothetical protein EDB86DRAFT_1311813 [Lactarius hatsudake]
MTRGYASLARALTGCSFCLTAAEPFSYARVINLRPIYSGIRIVTSASRTATTPKSITYPPPGLRGPPRGAAGLPS